MSGIESGLPDIQSEIEEFDLVRVDFGGFSPDTVEGRELLGMFVGFIGSSGALGGMIAERLIDAAQAQAHETEVIQAYETELTGPDIPGTRKFDPSPYGIDARILAAVEMETAARLEGSDEAAAQANEALTNTYMRMVEEGTEPVQYWQFVNRARRQVLSQLN